MTSDEVLGKTSVAWPLAAGVAGAVVLALVGGPQSLGMLFLVGPDSPDHIGAQVAIALCGAAALAVAVLFDRHWRWLVTAGVAGVVVATAIHAPKYQGLTARVVGGPDDPASQALPIPVAVGCLVVASAGVLVIGLFGVAREVGRVSRLGGALGGFVAVAAYYGVAVIGPLRSADATSRVVFLAVAAAVAIVAAFRTTGSDSESSRPQRIAGACAGAATVLPTAVVAVTGEPTFGTVTGGVVGLVVLGIAIVAGAAISAKTAAAVGATGLVLAAPVVLLVVIHDAPAGSTGYAWPIALAGVLAGAVAALRTWSAATLVALAVLPFIGLALRLGDGDHVTAEVIVWALLFLAMAAVAATAGRAFRVVGTPAFGAMATASALGVFGTVNLWRAAVDSGGGAGASIGHAGHWVSVVLLVCAVPVLLMGGRDHRTAAINYEV